MVNATLVVLIVFAFILAKLYLEHLERIKMKELKLKKEIKSK